MRSRNYVKLFVALANQPNSMIVWANGKHKTKNIYGFGLFFRRVQYVVF